MPEALVGGKLAYRIPEAAKLLAVSKSKMWKLVKDGHVETVRVFGMRRITDDELRRHLMN